MREEDVTIIGSSDRPTSVFVASGKHKVSLKQRLQKKSFELRKKVYLMDKT